LGPCAFGSQIFLISKGFMVGVPSFMQPSISFMKAPGEIGGMMMIFSFSIFSRAFPPACNPTLSRASLGIKIRPLSSTITSFILNFPPRFIPTVGNIRLAVRLNTKSNNAHNKIACWMPSILFLRAIHALLACACRVGSWL